MSEHEHKNRLHTKYDQLERGHTKPTPNATLPLALEVICKADMLQ